MTNRNARQSNRDDSEDIRILIVDDHPIVRKGLVGMINQEPDMQVCAEAEDYYQALEIIKSGPFDLAIVDLTLEGIGGLELIKQVLTQRPALPILVLSMHDESLYAQRVLKAGAKGYIMKQEGAGKLVTAIRTVHRGEVYLSKTMSAKILGGLVGGKRVDHQSPLERLSDRELEIFGLLGRGLGTRQIAERLCVSIKTVESHREHIKNKLNIKNASELVQHATQWVIHESAD